MERAMGLEPTTTCLGSRSSTTELRPRKLLKGAAPFQARLAGLFQPPGPAILTNALFRFLQSSFLPSRCARSSCRKQGLRRQYFAASLHDVKTRVASRSPEASKCAA
jgi:hypothetical protein